MMYKAKQINAATLNPIPFTTPINIYKKHAMWKLYKWEISYQSTTIILNLMFADQVFTQASLYWLGCLAVIDSVV